MHACRSTLEDPTVVFAVAKAFDSFADLYFGYQQRRHGLRFIAVGQLLNGGLSLLLASVALFLTRDLLLTVVAYAIGSALSLFGWVRPGTRRLIVQEEPAGRGGGSVADVVGLLHQAAPLGVVMLLAALGANIPRYVVEGLEGRNALGIFGAVSYVVLVGANVVAAIGAAFSPRLARAAAAGDRENFRRTLRHLLVLCAALGLAGAALSALVGGLVLRIVYTPEIAEYQWLLVLLSLASVLTFVATGTSVAVTAARRFRAQVPVLALAVAVGALAAYVSVSAWGLAGTAVAIAVTGAVQAAGGIMTLRAADRATMRQVVR